MIAALISSLFLGVIHLWQEKIFFQKEANKLKTMSFLAGASVTYIFLFILPDFYKNVFNINQWLFIFILLGFSLLHLLEKYIYEHTEKEERLFKFKELHFFIFFLYYLILGVILVDFFEISFVTGFLFFLPIMFYTAVSRVSFGEIHTRLREQKIFRILLSVATLFGVILARAISSQIILYYTLSAFIIGAFTYVVFMDYFPRESKGSSKYFILGVLLYFLLLLLPLII